MWMFKRKPVVGSDILQDKLMTSLTTFIELYSSEKDSFIKTSDDFAQACVEVQELNKESKKDNAAIVLLVGFCGASLGAVFGALSGAASGGLGAVGAAALYSGDLNALQATAGFFGGVMAGMGGGTFSGALGGALGAVAESMGHSVENAGYSVAWSAIGAGAGAGIGHIFGGTVGAVGGAFGGGVGGLIGLSVSVGLMRSVLYGQRILQSQDPQQHEAKKVSAMEKIQHVFRKKTSALEAELFIINSISSEMDTNTGAHCVAAQSSKSLTALSSTEKALGNVQKAINIQQLTSWVLKATEEWKQLSEDLARMKTESEKFLASWSS